MNVLKSHSPLGEDSVRVAWSIAAKPSIGVAWKGVPLDVLIDERDLERSR